MKYYVLNGTKKYDNVQNEDKGWYRDLLNLLMARNIQAIILKLIIGKELAGKIIVMAQPIGLNYQKIFMKNIIKLVKKNAQKLVKLYGINLMKIWK